MSRGLRAGCTVEAMTYLKTLVASLFLVAACGGDGSSTADCVSLCSEAQAGDCTQVEGNCSSFCVALDGVQGPSNCTSQRDTYESCLEQTPNVCDTNCGAQENALAACVQTYCMANPTNADCQTLAASF